jgi:NADP-dependent 3-hydroxy acid dehydrogenase YdfG
VLSRRKDKLNELKMIENKGGEALVVIADVTKKVDMEKLVDKTLKEYGTVHAIINNAGLMPLSFVKKTKTDEWRKWWTMVNVLTKIKKTRTHCQYFIDSSL